MSSRMILSAFEKACIKWSARVGYRYTPEEIHEQWEQLSRFRKELERRLSLPTLEIISSLKAELAAEREDAERWRKVPLAISLGLHGEMGWDGEKYVVMYCLPLQDCTVYYDTIKAAVDAARKEGE